MRASFGSSRIKRGVIAGLALGALVTTAACGSSDDDKGDGGEPKAADKGSVTISGQNFPEATLMASVYEQLLEAEGYDVTVKLVGTRDVYMAAGQFPGDVDIVPEYLGGIADYLNTQANGADAEPITSPDVDATLTEARKLAEAKGITLLEPAEAADYNAFFVTKEFAEENDLTDLSSLGESGLSIVLAAAKDCGGRTDCGGGLENTYGIKISKILELGFGGDVVYQSVLKDESQLGETASTDGALETQGLVLLADDQKIQPAQNLLPAISSEFLAEHPDVKETLEELSAVLTTDDLTAMNGAVGNDREKPEDVAKAYLEEKGLI